MNKFYLENILNLTHEFSYNNFHKIKLLNFLVETVKKNNVSNLMHLQDETVHLIFLQKEVLKKGKC